MKDRRLVGIPLLRKCPKCGVKRGVIEFTFCERCDYHYDEIEKGLDKRWKNMWDSLATSHSGTLESGRYKTPEEYKDP